MHLGDAAERVSPSVAPNHRRCRRLRQWCQQSHPATLARSPRGSFVACARPYLRPIWAYFLTASILSRFLVQTKYVNLQFIKFER